MIKFTMKQLEESGWFDHEVNLLRDVFGDQLDSGDAHVTPQDVAETYVNGPDSAILHKLLLIIAKICGQEELKILADFAMYCFNKTQYDDMPKTSFRRSMQRYGASEAGNRASAIRVILASGDPANHTTVACYAAEAADYAANAMTEAIAEVGLTDRTRAKERIHGQQIVKLFELCENWE